MLEVQWVDVKNKIDERGKLSIIQNAELPFEIKRIFWIYDVERGMKRGNHAHYNSRQFTLCVRGSCKILLDNGKEKREVNLKADNKGIIVEPYMWHHMSDFSEDCILLVLASNEYDERDYIRSYDEFKQTYKL